MQLTSPQTVICLEKPFKDYGLHKYSFRSTCVEDSELEDGTERIFLSTKGEADDVSENMKNFLSYLTGQEPDDDFTRRIERAVQNARTQCDWSVEYMTLYEKLEMEREAGRKEGLAEGLEKGEIKGREEGMLEELTSLIQDGILTRDAAASRAESKYGIKREDFLKELDAGAKWFYD